MADAKISALPEATTLGNTDVVVVVQGGVTKKATMLTVKNTVPPTLTTVTSVTDTDMVLLDGNRQITIANLKIALGLI